MEQGKGAIVALGMFDGMHIGHRALIHEAVGLARQNGCAAAAYTFRNHPMSVLGGEVRMLGTPEERGQTLRALGVADVWMAEFTQGLAGLSPEDFIALLRGRWQLRSLVVGFNYTFGAMGAGTPETLRALGEAGGFTVTVLPPVEYCGAPVSSTRIRKELEQGGVRAAAEMLARPYTLAGTVIQNRHIGRRIGFPTANIAPEPDRVLPGRGVYATRASLGGQTFPAVTNVGTNPTVGGDRLSVETHLIGYAGDAYGETLSVAFLERLRGERRFDSVEALKAQIACDVEAAMRVEAP